MSHNVAIVSWRPLTWPRGVQIRGPAGAAGPGTPGRHRGAVQVRGGLLQRQRQPAQLLGDLLCHVLGEVRDTGPQQRDRRRQVDHVQLHHPAQGGEPAAAGGDDHMPGNPRRQRAARKPRPDVLHRVGVVEDQQPARDAAQPVMDLPLQDFRIGNRVQAQLTRQRA